MVPITVKTVELIMSMAVVHLLELGSKFIKFRVLMFRCLSMKVTDTVHICRRIPIHAFILMILKVKHGNTDTNVGNEIRHLWKVCDESIEEVDAV